MKGKLIVVSTPIGNMGDLPRRALETLRTADLVACEDTRRTGLLLQRLGIKQPLISVHEHNERSRLPRLLAFLEEGKTLALASDAGTPLLADPGFPLVRAALEAGHRVEHLPGTSALLTALVVSGLPPYPFTFAGYPPSRGGKRRTFLQKWADLDHTLIFFEAPHRIVACLEDTLEILGDRPAAVARELTKMHEEVLRGSLSQILEELRQRDSVKGELTVVLSLKKKKRARRPAHQEASPETIQEPPRTRDPQ